ncbi:hypothetical protein VFPPC_13222 [Pochonia chlamydosporia 170]|uniref:GST N-terminal domain-containing protein n=1 Tax=Pochonia chlamydosporia 170 TaxID=1380566 RepID=A0A179F787_METCM|nr:hypothetical protein VFPPC_13222 [Pochonia chlamydosporia 170]OAQ61191.1 hypothetical protein VFPPC_13222 [Pochonia chlamydosporia 170]
MSTYELRYFSLRARAETIRLLLLASGSKFTEVTPDWPADKTQQPLCQLPVLIETLEDGEKFTLSDSIAIEKYLAAKAGLLVQTGLRATARENQLRGQIEDLFALQVRYARGAEGGKEAAVERYKVLADAFVKYHEALLAENGNNGHYFGTSTTYMDLALFTWVMFLRAKSNAGMLIPGSADFFSAAKAPGIDKVYTVVRGDGIAAAYVATLEE